MCIYTEIIKSKYFTMKHFFLFFPKRQKRTSVYKLYQTVVIFISQRHVGDIYVCVQYISQKHMS